MRTLLTTLLLSALTLTAPQFAEARSSGGHHYSHSDSAGLSNDRHYVNKDGETVHSPAKSSHRPAKASAQCADGTYSFSKHRRGTCSRHGGVK